MNNFKLCLCVVALVFLLCIVYLNLQIQIRKLSYEISEKNSCLQRLFDERSYCLYNLYKICNFNNFEDSDKYKFASNESFIRINIPQKGNLEKETKLAFWQKILFGFTKTAQAQE